MISEKIELLGKGLYTDIPNELTLKSMPTSTELDYVGSEDFDDVMLHKILPKCVEENINFSKLLEIDYQWICRCLRILNYGPYYTTNAIYCDDCHQSSRGEYRVDLRTIGCNVIPEDFVNDVVIKKDRLLDFKKDIHIHLLTIQEVLNCFKDKLFQSQDGTVNRKLARICYMIHQIGAGERLTPVQTHDIVTKQMSAADFILLKDEVSTLTDFGMRAGGKTVCPKCNSTNAAFIALTDDRFFRPTVGDIREWANSRSERKD